MDHKATCARDEALSKRRSNGSVGKLHRPGGSTAVAWRRQSKVKQSLVEKKIGCSQLHFEWLVVEEAHPPTSVLALWHYHARTTRTRQHRTCTAATRPPARQRLPEVLKNALVSAERDEPALLMAYQRYTASDLLLPLTYEPTRRRQTRKARVEHGCTDLTTAAVSIEKG